MFKNFYLYFLLFFYKYRTYFTVFVISEGNFFGTRWMISETYSCRGNIPLVKTCRYLCNKSHKFSMNKAKKLLFKFPTVNILQYLFKFICKNLTRQHINPASTVITELVFVLHMTDYLHMDYKSWCVTSVVGVGGGSF